MRFFDPLWHAGGLTDAEHQARISAYSVHLESMLPKIPRDLATLAKRDMLHDALLRSFVISRHAGEIELNVRAGDLQLGYHDIDIRYVGAGVDDNTATVLAEVAADPGAEMLSDEIDRVLDEDSMFIHRLLFAPDREVEIRFADVTVSRRPVLSRNQDLDSR